MSHPCRKASGPLLRSPFRTTPSRHRRNSIRARWRITQRLVSVTFRYLTDLPGVRPLDLPEGEGVRVVRGKPGEAFRELIEEFLLPVKVRRVAAPVGRPGWSSVPTRRRRRDRDVPGDRLSPRGASRAWRRKWSMILCFRIPTSQVDSEEFPEKEARSLSAARKVSWTRSSAVERSLSRSIAYRNRKSPYRPTHSDGSRVAELPTHFLSHFPAIMAITRVSASGNRPRVKWIGRCKGIAS